MDLQGFSRDCAAILRRQFERRGFIIFQAEPMCLHGSLDGEGVAFEMQIFLREFLVGYITFSYHYHRQDYLIKKAGSDIIQMRIVHTDKPKRHRMVIRIMGVDQPHQSASHNQVANKTSAFWRGVNRIPATPILDSEGRLVGGRPKIRKWTAWAAKQFAEKYLPEYINDHAQYIHDV